MTTETDETYARIREWHATYWPAHPEELAEINARSDAMEARAEIFERALTDQLTAIKALRETDDGKHMLARIVSVIALEQLRCAALGCPEPSWEEALWRYRVLIHNRKTLEAIKSNFKQEASN